MVLATSCLSSKWLGIQFPVFRHPSTTASLCSADTRAGRRFSGPFSRGGLLSGQIRPKVVALMTDFNVLPTEEMVFLASDAIEKGEDMVESSVQWWCE